jgi:hypothetical protein
VRKSAADYRVQLCLHLVATAMRVEIVASNRRSFLFGKSSESVSDDRKLQKVIIIEVCLRKDLSTFGIFEFVDCFDTLIEFFTRLLHNKAHKQRINKVNPAIKINI